LQALQLELLLREDKAKDLERENRGVRSALSNHLFGIKYDFSFSYFFFSFSSFLSSQLLERWLQKMNEEASNMNQTNEQLEL